MLDFIRNVKIAPVMVHGTGTATRTSVAVDRRGYVSATFAAMFGSLNGGGTAVFKIQGSADNATWADLSGVSYTVPAGATGTVVALEVSHAPTRYLRAVVTKNGSNESAESIVCYLSRGDAEPVAYSAAYPIVKSYHAPEAA